MPEKCPKTPLHEHTTQIPLRGKIIQDFIKALDRHAAFKILLRLDASFAMSHVPSMPSGCTGRTSGFEAQTAKPAYMVVLRSKAPKPSIYTWWPCDILGVDACPDSTKCHNAF
jgi:hypothetical protein